MVDLELAARLVAGGGVLLLPAETVYGLSGDARRPDAAARIHQIKGSDPSKPLLALTDTWDRVARWVHAPDPVRRVWAVATLGAITLVLPATDACPAALAGADGFVGIRRSASPWVCDLVAKAGVPVFSTSANPSGDPPPARFEAVDPSIRRAVDLALDAGGELAGQPSTVARFDPEASQFEILRPGPVTAEALREATGAATR
ncbi:MAG: hypothetical protein Rubg2KO_16330 [Rubricoccaceae bacterium]